VFFIGIATLSAICLAFLLGWALPGRAPAPIAAAQATGGLAPREMIGAPRDQLAVAADLDFSIGDDRIVRAADSAPVEAPSQNPDEQGILAPDEADMAPPAPPPPPPPPPDPALVFRRQLVAVINEPDGQLAVLLATPGGRRRVRIGETFDGVWTLRSLTRDSAVLQDGRRWRRVPFFGGVVTAGDETND
jgi:hypothetical protein